MKQICCLNTILLSLVLTTAATAGELTLEEFTLRPAVKKSVSMRRGDDFEVGVKLTAVDTGEITYVIRTTDPLRKSDAPPALPHFENDRQLAFATDRGSIQLADNGPRDLAPAKHEFRARLSTKGWKDGRWYMAIFAHNTKEKRGGYRVVRASFAIDIQGDQVRLMNLEAASPTQFVRCELDPPVVKPGEPTRLCIEANQDDLQGVKVVVPHHLAEENILPDFVYDKKNTTGFLCDDVSRQGNRSISNALLRNNGSRDRDSSLTKMEIPLKTDGVRPGLYFMTVQMQAGSGGKPAIRHLALSIRADNARLKVRVSEPWIVWRGSSSGRFTRLNDGTLIFGGRYSKDRGKTWHKVKGGGIWGGCPELKDGSVIAMGYKFLPIAGKKGYYDGKLRRVTFPDWKKTISDATMYVPKAKAAKGHAFHKGPLCTNSYVQRPDGSLVALMMGWFEGDDKPSPCGYGGRSYSRTYVCESFDDGATWSFLSNLGYDFIGSEGYNEGAIEKMPNDDIVAVVRTGNMADKSWHDNPVMFTRSTDGGKSWAKPWRVGVNGCYPDVELLSDGQLAISTGRPGAYVVFSDDGGQTWTDLTLVDAAPYSGYTALIETRPGELLVAFAEGYQRPDIENNIRMAYVWYEKDSE